MWSLILKIVLWLCFAFVYVRLLIPYVGFFARFMFNERVGWDKYVEKPRLVFYGLGLALMHGSYPAFFDQATILPKLFYVLNWFIFASGIAFTQLTWTNRFKRVFIPKIKEKLKSSKNFNISISESQLGKLYDNMIRYDMVLIDKTSKDDFVRCFLEDWKSHGSKIYLKLKNSACKEFYELFKANFPKNDLQLVDFIKNSDLLRREDGQPYNYDTVRNALTRNRVSKRSEELEAIFASFS
ncbi:hypothetical protein [Flagellimonas onchidii]|uniref:hypothetical protein n=1 Tax=Flagellimonas onchidii TaxID=2562684 RepID=UPI0010A5A8F8|nr:hypothetical protein [Allomuricauda onchidii]